MLFASASYSGTGLHPRANFKQTIRLWSLTISMCNRKESQGPKSYINTHPRRHKQWYQRIHIHTNIQMHLLVPVLTMPHPWPQYTYSETHKYTCLNSCTRVHLPSWATQAHRHMTPDTAAFIQIIFTATSGPLV